LPCSFFSVSVLTSCASSPPLLSYESAPPCLFRLRLNYPPCRPLQCCACGHIHLAIHSLTRLWPYSPKCPLAPVRHLWSHLPRCLPAPLPRLGPHHRRLSPDSLVPLVGCCLVIFDLMVRPSRRRRRLPSSSSSPSSEPSPYVG
jgi:hypothetical protein